MTIRLFYLSKKLPKLLFTTLIELTISKKCGDHFSEIDWINKMTPIVNLLMFKIIFRTMVLGMGDGSMTTLTIADPDKSGITQYLKSLPSRNPEVFYSKILKA